MRVFSNVETEIPDRILVGMVKSSAFLRALSSKLSSESQIVFESRAHEQLAKLAWDHFRKHEVPIESHWDVAFDSWAENVPDSLREAAGKLSGVVLGMDVGEMVSQPEALAEEAICYFKLTGISTRVEHLQSAAERKNVKLASEVLSDLTRILHEVPGGMFHGGDLDKDRIREAMLDEGGSEVLFSFPGDAGKFFNSEMKRQRLVAFMGTEKAGKSHWMIEMAYQAISKHCNVAYYSVGDLTLKDLNRRMISRVKKRPYLPENYKVPKNKYFEDGEESIEMVELEETEVVSEKMTKVESQVLQSRYVKTRPKFKSFASPMDSTSVSDIIAHLESMIEFEGWIPDVVVIDYADILAPEQNAARDDFRHKVNATWKALRKLSQEMNCLVITGTQANRAAYGGKSLISKDNASEDKRINAHVNAIIGINRTEEEKDNGIFRLNYPVVREKNISELTQLRCAGCLGFSHPLMVSRLEHAGYWKQNKIEE